MGCCASEENGIQADRLNSLGKLESRGKDVSLIGAPRGDESSGRKKLYATNEKLKLGYWKMRGLA